MLLRGRNLNFLPRLNVAGPFVVTIAAFAHLLSLAQICREIGLPAISEAYKSRPDLHGISSRSQQLPTNPMWPAIYMRYPFSLSHGA